MNTILAIFILVNIAISAFGIIVLFSMVISGVENDLTIHLKKSFEVVREGSDEPLIDKIIVLLMWLISFLLTGHIWLISFIIGAFSIIKNNKK